MKKTFFLCLITLSFAVFTGCKAKTIDMSNKVKIICTRFPEYDWADKIIGHSSSNTVLTLLVKNGVDLHSYQPSANDILQISTCDLFVYVGGESDKWIEEALATSTNKNMVVIKLMDVLKDKVLEEDEGLESELGEGSHDDHDEEALEYDEHVWLSVKNAKICCDAICNAVCSLDKENEQLYRKNLDNYQQQLAILDQRFASAAIGATNKTVLFCDRFPFKYLMDDYGIQYYAAFSGCSAESEASFETVAFLANKIDELGIKTLLTIETSNQKLARTVNANSNYKFCDIVTLDSMQNTTLAQAFKGKTYIATMTENLENLKKALY